VEEPFSLDQWIDAKKTEIETKGQVDVFERSRYQERVKKIKSWNNFIIFLHFT
jgi:hypothetical protein